MRNLIHSTAFQSGSYRETGSSDAGRLTEALRTRIRGEVRFDAASRALYATDGSNYRQVPIGVVIPRDAEDAASALAVCRQFSAPVLARGAGTSLCGQCCNVAVVFDFSKYMDRILALDPQAKTARVQPGVVLDDLRGAAEQYHLTFAPDPSTHTHNTLGGMLGNNSCGPHSVMAGRTSDNVIELEVLTYDGLRLRLGATGAEPFAAHAAGGGREAEIYQRLDQLRERYGDEIRKRFPDIPRRVSGYNLMDLLPEHDGQLARALVGSEGTCCMILEAVVRLVDSPPVRSTVALGYADVFAAADHVPEVMRHDPVALEGMDDLLVEDMRLVQLHLESIHLLPPGRGWLLVEFGGQTRDEADAKARAMMKALERENSPPAMKLFDDPSEEAKIWTVRKSGLGATAHVPNKKIAWEGWEDSAVPPARLGGYLRELRALFEKYDYSGDLYGHFGQGCVHTRIDFDLETASGIEQYKRFMEEASDLVLRYGGSLSGEHGDGQSKAQFLGKMYGETLLQAFREFKTIWDPRWKMNPGKVVDPYRIDENLRLGTFYNPEVPATHFRYPNDEGSFPRAMLRCVGVGECRKHSGGTMCPSYMATREEKRSTRGRARLLFEMLRGEVIGGWRDEGVREALELCLSCKACRHECPVKVDMATYKAEFFSHYYQGRLRPAHAYAFGLIDVWAALGARVPTLANGLMSHALTSRWLKTLSGMAPERALPRLAQNTFKSWFFGRRGAVSTGKRVLLWPDTFNNYFYPDTARAAVELLEAAGFSVSVPRAALCCGRPLYEFGMLDLARKRLMRILHVLDEPLREGVPIVVLEPACASVFSIECGDLIPFQEQGKRLAGQTFLLGEFLRQHAPQFAPRPQGRLLLHGHCHHRAHNDLRDELGLLQRLRTDVETLDSGCCGMAGSFGFEKSKYAISRQLGERVLFPAVRAAGADVRIVADGFSCREQIRQGTGREAAHLADVLRAGLEY